MERMRMGDTSDCYKIGRMYVCCAIKLFDKAENIYPKGFTIIRMQFHK